MCFQLPAARGEFARHTAAREAATLAFEAVRLNAGFSPRSGPPAEGPSAAAECGFCKGCYAELPNSGGRYMHRGGYVCASCHGRHKNGDFCPLCLQTWGQDEVDMVSCDKCNNCLIFSYRPTAVQHVCIP